MRLVLKTYRVNVRGRFDDLDETGRAALLAVVDDHDVLHNGFTEEGSLAYTRALDFFTFRVIVRGAEDAVADLGLRAATTALDAFGVDYRELRATTTDMDAIKIRRKPTPSERG